MILPTMTISQLSRLVFESLIVPELHLLTVLFPTQDRDLGDSENWDKNNGRVKHGPSLKTHRKH